MVYTRRCRTCVPDYYSEFNGSIWSDWDHEAVRAYPREVLMREFLWLAERWERWEQEGG